jgi:thioredoxin-related protein
MKTTGATMRQVRWLLGLVLAVCGGAVLAGIEDGPRHAGHPDWMTPVFVDLDSDLERVRNEGKTGVMVLFTTQGCTYCAEFINRSLGDPVLQQRVRDNFVSIGLEIFDDADMTDHHGNDVSIKQFAVQQKAGMAPTLLFYGPDNDLVFRAVGYQSPQRFGAILDYLIGGSHRDMTFRDYLRHAAAAPAMADPVYDTLRPDPLFMRPPYALARQPVAADRPLLVIFEQTGCADCRRFHDGVLSLTEVRSLLERFEVVRLDAQDDTTPVLAPDGTRTTPAAWYAAEGFSRVPALLFVDEAGNPVLHNDAVTERQRMLNMAGLVLDKKYADGWTYQRYARSKAIERNRQAQQGQ